MKSSRLFIIGAATIAVAGAAYLGIRMHSSSEDQPVVVDENGGFSGIVVDGVTNKPLIGATITAKSTDKIWETSTQSSDNGRFSFDLSDGNYLITSEFPGYTSRGKNDLGREINVANQTRFVNAKLNLWPTATVKGRVSAGSTGIKANVKLTYNQDSSGAEDYLFQSLTAGENGLFQIDNAPAGVTTISISADGFASVDLRDIILKAGGTIDLGDIPLQDGVSLFGQITDIKTNTGIRNVNVTVKNTSNEVIASTTTDNSGNYRLPALDMMQISVDISAEGYHPASKKMQLQGNANRELNFDLMRAWGLTLVVDNQTERTPIYSYISITDVVSNKVVYHETLDNGTFSLDSIKGGPFIIEAESSDHFTKTSVRASTGDSVYLRLKPYGKILVKALNSDGTALNEGQYNFDYKPLQGGPFTENVWTSLAASEFTIPNLVEGIYRVRLKSEGHSEVISHEFRITHGDNYHLTIQLTEGGVLTGHVVSTEGHNVEAEITLSDDRKTTTDKDGYFTFDRMPVDPVSLVIKPLYERTEVENATFDNIVVPENNKLDREFRINAPGTDRRANRMERMRERRERMENLPWGDGKPPWGDGQPPWGDGKPPWGDGQPPWGDGKPPWGDGQPPWGDGKPPWGDGQPPWGDGKPPWGDGQPPWGDGKPPWGDGQPPWGDGQPPWGNDRPRRPQRAEEPQPNPDVPNTRP